MNGGLVWSLANGVYRSRLAARLLFGIEVSPLGPEDHYFDVTSWVLLKRASAEVSPETRVVDLGAGSQAIIGLALWRRFGCPVTATELHPELAEQARSNIRRNRASIRVVESRLFESLPEDFDLVIFNPPYVPTEEGLKRQLPEGRRSQWDGGADGLETVRRFTEALADRSHALRALLGVNSMHVDLASLRSHLASLGEVSLEDEFLHPFLPVAVYRLTKG